MDQEQYKFQLKKKLTLFGSLFLVGIIAIVYFSCH